MHQVPVIRLTIRAFQSGIFSLKIGYPLAEFLYRVGLSSLVSRLIVIFVKHCRYVLPALSFLRLIVNLWELTRL